MTIHIPGPLALLLKVLAVAALIYVIKEERAPMTRYLKLERM
jgi:hypothetical protein